MGRITRPMTDGDTALSQDYLTLPWGSFPPRPLQRALIALGRGTFLHRGKMRHRMTLAIMALGGPLDVTFRDCRYRIEGRNNLMEYGLLLHPDYNGEEIRFLAEAMQGGGTAVDIGCNIGLYSLPLAHAAGSQGRVISIDANAGVLARLRVNAAASGLDDRITLVNCAVGDHAGQVDLSIRGDDLSIVTVTETVSGGVPMRPLAEILATEGVTRVNALKIDIEGYEDAALVPFLDQATDEMLPDRISIERGGADGGDYPGCAAALARRGYVLAGRTRSNSLYRLERKTGGARGPARP